MTPVASKRPLTDEEMGRVRRLGFKQRSGAVLVGFMSSGLSLLILFSPSSTYNEGVHTAEVVILSVVGLVLAAVSMESRRIAARVLAIGTVFQTTASVRALADGKKVIDVGNAYFRAMPFFRPPAAVANSLKSGNGPLKIEFADPGDQGAGSHRVLLFKVNGLTLPRPLIFAKVDSGLRSR